MYFVLSYCVEMHVFVAYANLMVNIFENMRCFESFDGAEDLVQPL